MFRAACEATKFAQQTLVPAEMWETDRRDLGRLVSGTSRGGKGLQEDRLGETEQQAGAGGRV